MGDVEEAVEKVMKMSLELMTVHFTLCRLSVTVIGQAEQCLLGVQVPELWGKGNLEIKLIVLEYAKNET